MLASLVSVLSHTDDGVQGWPTNERKEEADVGRTEDRSSMGWKVASRLQAAVVDEAPQYAKSALFAPLMSSLHLARPGHH